MPIHAACGHLTYTQPFLQEGIPTSLLKLSTDNSSRAVKMFSGIQKYMDSGDDLPMAVRTDIAQKLLHQGLKRPELKDELYMQLLKQSRGNPNPATAGEQLLCGGCTCLFPTLAKACTCQVCRPPQCQVQPVMGAGRLAASLRRFTQCRCSWGAALSGLLHILNHLPARDPLPPLSCSVVQPKPGSFSTWCPPRCLPPRNMWAWCQSMCTQYHTMTQRTPRSKHRPCAHGTASRGRPRQDHAEQ